MRSMVHSGDWRKQLEAGLDISLSEQRRRRQILIYKTVLWRNSVTTIQVSCQKIWLSSILILNRLIQSYLNCKSSPLRLIRVCQSKRRDIQNRTPHRHKLEVAKVWRSVTRLEREYKFPPSNPLPPPPEKKNVLTWSCK